MSSIKSVCGAFQIAPQKLQYHRNSTTMIGEVGVMSQVCWCAGVLVCRCTKNNKVLDWQTGKPQQSANHLLAKWPEVARRKKSLKTKSKKKNLITKLR